MADFVSVLRRAVGNLETNTETTRQAIYAKARAALRAQLEAVDPPLGADQIDQQIKGLDQAIAELEAEFAPSPAPANPPVAEPPGSSPSDPKPVIPPVAPAPQTPDAPQSPATPPGSSTETSPQTSTATPSETFRSAVTDSGTLGGAASAAARQARETLDRIGSDAAPPAESVSQPRPELAGDRPAPRAASAPAPDMGPATAPTSRDGSAPEGQPTALYDDDDEGERSGSGRFVAWIILLLVIVGIAGVGFWQRQAVMDVVAALSGGEAQQTASDDGKISDRLPGAGDEEAAEQETDTPQQGTQQQRAVSEQPATNESGTGGQTAAELPIRDDGQPAASETGGERIAQALLVEETGDSTTPASSVGGSVDWVLADDAEAINGVEKVIRGTVAIPDKDLRLVVTIRRNLDQALPASHLIELVFDAGDGFANEGVANIPGIFMKATPRSTGQPLVGAVVPVMDGYFLVGLSESDLDQARNVSEMQTRDFIDIPIAYKDGGRAVLSLAKGETGGRVFEEAFTAWGG